jgi:small subunit ribosomal protein S6
MKEESNNLYEGMFIISTTLSEEARQKAYEKVVFEIEKEGGVVKKPHEWGKRRLADTIGERRDGYYYVLYFEAKPSAIARVAKEYHLHEDLLRFMILRAEKVVEEIKFAPLVKQV